MQGVRIYEIPDCKMVSSGIGMFGQEKFDGFLKWFETLPKGIFPEHFLFWDGVEPSEGGLHWLHIYREGMQVPPEYAIIDFKGGLYAVATDIDQRTDMDAMSRAVDAFLAENNLARDTGRAELGNVITSPAAFEALGYNQMDYYTPVRAAI